jgi:hypothetical protein
MNRNEIMEIQTPALSPHPAELILAGVKEKLNTFEREHQNLVRQLESQHKQVECLQSKVEQQGKEKKV